MSRSLACVLFIVALLCAGRAMAATPWTLARALDLPSWLTLSGQSRVRYETLDGQWRAGGRGGDQLLTTHTTVLLEAGAQAARIGAELLDARAFLDDAGTPLDTTQVGALDLLQAYVVLDFSHAFAHPYAGRLRLGRQTRDFGSRRLLARNRFRNTINGFTGADWQLTAPGGWHADLFVAMPQRRLPTALADLDDNEAEIDAEDTGTVVWLAAWRSAPHARRGQLELYVLGLDESDARFATRNRRLVTPALRWFREAAPATLDFQLEAALQTGRSRSDDRPTTRRDLTHFAQYANLQLGYTFDTRWSPRGSVFFDYASGDRDPRDGDNERFDTLFGARRFDYGPTGIWGPFLRTNLSSPGARLNLAPGPRLTLMTAWRAIWLASRRDEWVAARVSDRSGRAGSFIGHQFEGSASWAIVPGNLNLEVGAAWLAGGSFPERAPNAGEDAGSYVYAHVQFVF